MQAEVARANGDHSIPGIKAAFAMAPAIVQGFNPASFATIKVPVSIVLGGADTVAPPDTNGILAAHAIPDAELTVLPGVGHYDFLPTCTTAAMTSHPLCQAISVPQDRTHAATLSSALAFFAKHLGTP